MMRDNSISQLPVLQGHEVIGSVNESRVLNAIIDNPTLRTAHVDSFLSDPFPFVLPTTRIDAISKMISADNPAVIVQGENGQYDIITKSDLISALVG
jgi:cystathionine beta-synthase